MRGKKKNSEGKISHGKGVKKKHTTRDSLSKTEVHHVDWATPMTRHLSKTENFKEQKGTGGAYDASTRRIEGQSGSGE